MTSFVPTGFPNIDFRRAAEITARIIDRRIIVLGDIMLDEFVWGDVTRISPEAPVPVVDIRRESIHLGGAANVYANLIALGADATVIGVIGDDAAGRLITTELDSSAVDESHKSLVVDPRRPTTVKTRIIAHNQLIVRTDREKRFPVEAQIETEIINRTKSALVEADALIISDYDKGCLTPLILAKVLTYASTLKVPILVDPKFRNLDSYRPATFVTPNHHEVLRYADLENDTDDCIVAAAENLRARLGCRSVLVTRGPEGMMLLDESTEPIFIKAAAREVYDVTGAGDTCVATLAAATAAGATSLESAMLANHAAGVVVGKIGTATATADEIIASLKQYHD